MKAINYNSVKHYNLTEGASLPEWVSQQKKAELLKEGNKRKVELLQGLEFKKGSPSCLEVTADGLHMWAAGEYPAQIRCYDFEEVSLKFVRHVDNPVLGMAPISDDYKKIVLLEQSRFVEFHHQGGRHHKIRIPKEGRSVVYDPRSAHLIFPTSSSSVFFFDCDYGSFKEAAVTSSTANNCAAVCPAHPLIAAGGEDGVISCIDIRDPSSVVATLSTNGLASGYDTDTDNEVTALVFDQGGMNLLAGTSEGVIGLYDLRKRSPVLVKDHNNSLPIKRIMYHSCFDSLRVLSADSKSVKIWDATSGDPFTTVEVANELQSFVVPKTSRDKDGGIILAACDTPHVNAFFVPQLGPAPGWCSYLENITEELEETDFQAGQYEDYKFVTREELEALHLTHLLTSDSDQIQPYMHGFYVDLQLYRTSKSVLDPNEWKEMKKQKTLLKKEAEDRITVVRKKKRDVLKPVEDDRFKSKIDKDNRYKIDKESEGFLQYNSHLKENSAFKAVDEEVDYDSDGASSGLSDTAPAMKPRGYTEENRPQLAMYELKEGREILETKKEGHYGRKKEKYETLPLGERLKKLKETAADSSKVHTAEGGAAKQITFTLPDAPRRKRSNSEVTQSVHETESEPKRMAGKKGGKGKSGKGGKGGGKKGGKGGKGKKGRK